MANVLASPQGVHVAQVKGSWLDQVELRQYTPSRNRRSQHASKRKRAG